MELSNAQDRPHSGRPRFKRTRKAVKAVHQKERRNPKRSMRNMEKYMAISEKSVRNIVQKDFGV
jgi:hypothetical protein